MGVLRYDYQGKSYPKREFELIDRYWGRFSLKTRREFLKISQACMRRLIYRGRKNFKDFVDSSKFTKVTLANLLFSVELLKKVDRQGKRREIRT